ncbi:hypothetical protein EV192_10842 [Actinocrispum wychmicini]|uniref:Uncharacterized protein n=1 Tax=Actinocrispum wychmicini TaxID=1213861 RepID=A0A4R2J829_9PSEU|nr:hypothetical protein EV192_10842 [Actinocrispum wychmicini]
MCPGSNLCEEVRARTTNLARVVSPSRVAWAKPIASARWGPHPRNPREVRLRDPTRSGSDTDRKTKLDPTWQMRFPWAGHTGGRRHDQTTQPHQQNTTTDSLLAACPSGERPIFWDSAQPDRGRELSRSSVGSVTSEGARLGGRDAIDQQTAQPSSYVGCTTVVREGRTRSAQETTSKPTIPMPSGTRTLCWARHSRAPTVIRLLAMKTASGVWGSSGESSWL